MPHSTIPCKPCSGTPETLSPRTDRLSSLAIESSQASAGGQEQDFKSFSNKDKCNSLGRRYGEGATPLLQPANDTAHGSARVQRSKSAPCFLGRLCVRPSRGGAGSRLRRCGGVSVALGSARVRRCRSPGLSVRQSVRSSYMAASPAGTGNAK